MYYERLSRVPFEEDMTHEFKGHRNFCLEDVPKWAQASKAEKASRKPISRNLCGFLNTGIGGTVYCGVTDEGIVHGLKLTQYQRDHVVGSIHDLMSRYNPPVPTNRYKVKFVPVISASLSKEQKDKMLNYKPRDFVDKEERQRKHTFRTAEYCWCDKDAQAQFQHEILITDYIVEITILSWDPDNPENEGLGTIFNLHPIHKSERGQLYFRNQASLCQYSLQEVANLTRLDVRSRKKEIIRRLKDEIAQLRIVTGSYSPVKEKKESPSPNAKAKLAMSPTSVFSQ